ncbi:hypothetical protein ACLOJK_004235 [Asimina triloba]
MSINCYNALPEHGKVIIAEWILPEVPSDTYRDHCVFLLDNIMLAHNPGGKERTEKEFRALAKGAGFAGFKLFSCAYGTWIMEFSKN